jgi:outer membrane protein assembly factor BamE (lipoprotein component of BamABCDE complex)
VACATNRPSEEPKPDDLTLGKVQAEIRVGMSSAEVVEVLGSPNIVTTDDQRRESWVYDKVSTQYESASRSSFGTLILFGGSNASSARTTRQRTLTIIIKFDDEHRVRDFAYNYTQF